MERGTKGGTDLMRRLDALRPRYERLRTQRIRAEADVERLTAEIADARREAREELGSDDPAAIEAMIAEADAADAAAVEAFAELVGAIDARLARLAEGG